MSEKKAPAPVEKEEAWLKKIVPFIPSCHRPPNKFVRYYNVPFDDGHGHTGVETRIVYLNKNKEECDEQYRIKWDDM